MVILMRIAIFNDQQIPWSCLNKQNPNGIHVYPNSYVKKNSNPLEYDEKYERERDTKRQK